jgi:hypothetical protein
MSEEKEFRRFMYGYHIGGPVFALAIVAVYVIALKIFGN